MLRRLRTSNSPTAAVVQFAVTGALAVLLLGFVAVTLLRHTGTSEAIRDAKQFTRLAGDGIVAPALTPGLERGDPRALAAMDRLMRSRVLVDPVVRVKIWNSAGKILYSDEPALIGTGYTLRSDELSALRSGAADAEVSDLSRPENRFERRYGKLLEVYLGVQAPNGDRLLFEAYQRFSSISASGRRLWTRFLPALILAMVLLELAQIPLAWRLARRVQRGQQEREALLRRAIEASEIERRRIAGELHDSAVQDLAGLSYGLAGAAEQLPPDSPVRSTVTEGAAQARMTMRELRSLLVDIYPPTLQRSGLHAALEDLVRGCVNGTRVTLDVPSNLELPAEIEALIFRTAQEALRNVRSHARADNAHVSVRRSGRQAVLEVFDDGRGFNPEEITRRGDGHFGLRVLGDLARDAGANLHVDSREGEGARVRLEVPVE